jgi:class 3 adenylate cyclase/predicted ATPase
MRCVSCGVENPKEMKFCTGCGASLAQRCPSCASENPPTAKFCGQCGTALGLGTAPDSFQPVDRNPPAGISTPSGGAAAARPPAEAERRQLTIMFCDLVGSTSLSERLDPEELRRVLRDYQAMCATIIRRYDGTVAQYLGDGLLMYFGYPRAHEDDAQRAVHAGVGIVEALDGLNTKLHEELGVRLSIRLGIHTGLVVVGELGDDSKREHLALGETPNVAARVQALAEIGTVTITGSTFRLIEGLFECKDLGSRVLKGISQPLRLYQVLHDSTGRSRLEVSDRTSVTPLVGRKQEMGLLLDRWEEVTEGVGQVVVLSGEAGVGKSRLLRILKEDVSRNPQAWLTSLRCSPYHQNSAFYPIIDMFEHVVLQFSRNDTVQDRQEKLEGLLVQYGLSLPETLPLFAALLSVPLPERYSPLALTPERQKQEILTVLMTMLLKRAAKQPLLLVVEDLQWMDPSTLELLNLIVDQGPSTGILAVFTCRPDFNSPWTGRSHLTQVTLNRLTRRQVADMVARVAGGKILPAELIQQIAVKTDGVPLFVEELTKMVLESGLLKEHDDHYELSEPLPALAIPTTLHDSLMARLDRLATVKEVAQLAATLGREFTFELLKAVSPLEEKVLERELAQLMEAGLLYQQGVLPRANFIFKHALIQEAAYQSLLKSKRQQYHRHIAEVLERQLTGIIDTKPELLAHHYTEAGLTAPAIVYWVRAGQRAVERSANAEAIGHLGHALDLLSPQPETPERARQELAVQMLLAQALMATRGMAAPEVERAYARARELCEVVGHSDQLLLALGGLGTFYLVRGNVHAALETGEQCLDVAQRLDDPGLLLKAHAGQGTVLVFLGELESSRASLARGLRLAEAMTPSPLDFGGRDAGVGCLAFDAWAACLLGSLDEAQASVAAALALAETRSHPFSRAFALSWAARLHQFRREERRCREQAETAIGLATEYGFTQWRVIAMMLLGSALAGEGRGDEGIDQLREGLAAWRAMGAELLRPYFLALLAEAYWRMGRADEGLATVVEALSLVERTGERMYEAELHRLQGELLRARESGAAAIEAAGACFQRALAAARRQGARALELRAAMSLSRLLEHADGGAREEARRALAEVYATFTTGFDTADLREARALLGSSPA